MTELDPELEASIEANRRDPSRLIRRLRNKATPRREGQGYTTDRNDPRLGHGVDTVPSDQHAVYLVLSEEERAKGFIRPLRRSYLHVAGPAPCGAQTTMGLPLCETYSRDPSFYGATYCCSCRQHFPVAQFVWDEDGEVVGS